MNTHRWQRARAGDLAYGRICACGNLKDEQALRCRPCYADARRDEAAHTCACGGPKYRRAMRCRRCANKLLLGNQHAAGHAQPANHPWRKTMVPPREALGDQQPSDRKGRPDDLTTECSAAPSSSRRGIEATA